MKFTADLQDEADEEENDDDESTAERLQPGSLQAPLARLPPMTKRADPMLCALVRAAEAAPGSVLSTRAAG